MIRKLNLSIGRIENLLISDSVYLSLVSHEV